MRGPSRAPTAFAQGVPIGEGLALANRRSIAVMETRKEWLLDASLHGQYLPCPDCNPEVTLGTCGYLYFRQPPAVVHIHSIRDKHSTANIRLDHEHLPFPKIVLSLRRQSCQPHPPNSEGRPFRHHECLLRPDPLYPRCACLATTALFPGGLALQHFHDTRTYG